MIVTAWSNGNPSHTGSGYGLKISEADRERFFDRSWHSVEIDLDGVQGVSQRFSE